MKKDLQQKWVSNVLQEAEHPQRSVPGEHVWDNILPQLRNPAIKNKIVQLSIVSTAAACILFLLTINIYTIFKAKDTNTSQNAMHSVVQYYNITNDKDSWGL